MIPQQLCGQSSHLLVLEPGLPLDAPATPRHCRPAPLELVLALLAPMEALPVADPVLLVPLRAEDPMERLEAVLPLWK